MPPVQIQPFQDHSATQKCTLHRNQLLQNFKHCRRCPLCTKLTFPGPHTLQKTSPCIKLTITGPYQCKRCPLHIKLNVSRPYPAWKMPPTYKSNIPGPPSPQKTPVLNVNIPIPTVQRHLHTSSRTQWFLDRKHKFKDIGIYNCKDTTVSGHIYKFKDIWIYIQHFHFLQCQCYAPAATEAE